MTTEITNAQIRVLRTEAGEAGDLEQVAICDRALDGDDDARAECAAVIAGLRILAALDDASGPVPLRRVK